jgi:acetyl esterase/lipase
VSAHAAAKPPVRAPAPAPTRPMLQSTLTFLNPAPRDAALRASLFGRFPRAFVLAGDAERLEREIKCLVGAMRRDGVELEVKWCPDAVHDFLMLAWWDERVREEAWAAIRRWVEAL